VHVHGHGEFQIFKQGDAGNVVCVVVPTRERTRAFPDGAPESMGGIGVRATELYKPVSFPGRGRDGDRMLGLLRRVQAVMVRLTRIGGVDGSEGLPRYVNFVGVLSSRARGNKSARLVQAIQENAEEGDIPPIVVQASRVSVKSRENLGVGEES